MVPKLFLSHCLDALVDQLVEQIENEPLDPIETRTIVVPNSYFKQWLVLEIAKRRGIAMGLKCVEIQDLVPSPLTVTQMVCLVYGALGDSQHPELVSYLAGKKKRHLELTLQLCTLFKRYGEYGSSLFKEKKAHWQHEILQKLFIDGPWKLPMQQQVQIREPLICFGIDFLPPVYWQVLLHAPSVAIYLFSPCSDFWSDLSSVRERKKMNQYWKQGTVSQKSLDALEGYLTEAPKLLANWGRLGRETLKIFDHFSLDIEDLYPSLEPDCLLKQIQYDLLTFKETVSPPLDDSIKVILTGSSKLKELEALRDEILRLDLPYENIAVLAPDIEPYVPLIEFIFGDQIPYRIGTLDVASQSSFRQGLLRILEICSGRWSAEEILTLFETPAFYRKQKWNEEHLETYRSWIRSTGISWGKDADHRVSILGELFGVRHYDDRGSWQQGLDQLLDALVFLKPMQVSIELFESLIQIVTQLKELDLRGSKTLSDWADQIEQIVENFLMGDRESEVDLAAIRSLDQLLFELKSFESDRVFPLEVIQHLLLRPSKVQVRSGHLHAVQFASLEEAAQLPTKALFLLGMDEESFPRLPATTTLDLLPHKIPDIADRDRYLFLQALFSAGSFLRIIYGHLSPGEGKPVSPSILVQELLNVTGKGIVTEYRGADRPNWKKTFPWPLLQETPLAEGDLVVSLPELSQLARHPWKFFLHKRHGIYLNDPLEETFAIQKGKSLRSYFIKGAPIKWPPGLFGKAMEIEVAERAKEIEERFELWNLKPFSLILQEGCKAPYWEGDHYIVPSIEIQWEKLTVNLVGEVKQASLKGFISFNDDTIGGTLKHWPEILVVAIALNAPQVWMAKNGKSKAIEAPEKSLKAFLEYYFQSLDSPSPLLPDWADALLRKGASELESKMKKKPLFQDPTFEWVLAAVELPEGEKIYQSWAPFLQQTFGELAQLYIPKVVQHDLRGCRIENV